MALMSRRNARADVAGVARLQGASADGSAVWRMVDLRQIARQGITLLGSLLDVVDGRLHFAANLNANLKIGGETFVQFVRTMDDLIKRNGIATQPEVGGFDHSVLRFLKESDDMLSRDGAGIGAMSVPGVDRKLKAGRQNDASTLSGSQPPTSVAARRY
jgi:hypothetical protein